MAPRIDLHRPTGDTPTTRDLLEAQSRVQKAFDQLSPAPVFVAAAPSTPTAPGEPGQMFVDKDFVYHCIANNVWRRAALAVW